MSEPMDTHFATIARRWERATLTERPDGSHVVRIPAMPLHGKYEQPTTDVWFVVPVGFPLAQPEHFYTDADLRAKGGSQPSYTMDVTVDEGRFLWFSHRLLFWDPQRDSLINYVGSIMRRLANPYCTTEDDE